MAEKRHRRRRRSVPAALSRLRTIAGIRPEFAGLHSIKEIATTGARLALKHVDAQAAAVYLFDQCGTLGRITLVGRDKNGCELDNNYVQVKVLLEGQSFLGKVLLLVWRNGRMR
jgi:alpha-D-ribose 1-methylphosphonate 5-triphosphate synthase subunit PhnG